MSNPNPNTSPDAGARPTLGHNASASSSTMPLINANARGYYQFPTTGHTPSPSGSSHSASASNSYFPGATPRQGDHSRMDSEAISWIAPEDFDPTSLFDAPIPRPHSAGHIPRVRSLSFGAASSLMGPHTPGGRDGAPSPYGLNPREGTSLRAASALGLNGGERPGSVALSINYTPSKFSDALAVGPRRRRRPKDLSRNPSDSGPNATEVEKLAMARGGGVDAFRKGESRMPDDRDDLHPVTSRQGFFDRADMKSRWTRFKVVLFVFNIARADVSSCLRIWSAVASVLPVFPYRGRGWAWIVCGWGGRARWGWCGPLLPSSASSRSEEAGGRGQFGFGGCGLCLDLRAPSPWLDTPWRRCVKTVDGRRETRAFLHRTLACLVRFPHPAPQSVVNVRQRDAPFLSCAPARLFAVGLGLPVLRPRVFVPLCVTAVAPWTGDETGGDWRRPAQKRSSLSRNTAPPVACLAPERSISAPFATISHSISIFYTIFALAGVIAILLIWLDILPRADIIRVANRPELIFTTLAAATALLTATIGWAGVMLNNRSFLAVYCLLLWFSFAFLVTPGYITYRHWSLNLQAKLNQAWSEDYSVSDRRRIQNALHCCGYFSPFVEASISATCYARSVLSGCKGPYFKYEHGALRIWWTVIFSLVGFHIILIAASLLCANHVTYRFGKGMMPKAYRLTSEAVAAIMENYAEQLGQEYGEGVARAFVERNSRAPSMVDLTDPNGAGSMSGHLRGVSARLDSIYGHQRNESGLGSVYSAGGDGNGSGSGRAGYGHLRAESYGDMGRMRGQSLHDPFAGGEMGVRMLDPQGDLRMDPMGMATSSSGGHSTSAGHSSSSMGLLLGTGAGTGGSGGGKYGTIEGTMPETAM
ncbi:hypothetical protein K438DRAFT_2082446 [Mycena galopus ATCC 62051]|nr:hypothetical protein K438DRAFT_2082446 [Mycena galopus ATCC 62051]